MDTNSLKAKVSMLNLVMILARVTKEQVASWWEKRKYLEDEIFISAASSELHERILSVAVLATEISNEHLEKWVLKKINE